MANRVQLTLLGLVLGLIANALHLHSMYVIKVNPIKAGDTLIMRALVQCALFGLWSTVARVINRLQLRRQPLGSYEAVDEDRPQQISLTQSFRDNWKEWVLAILSSFMQAICVLITFIGVYMMPLCDFVVFSFTTPVFTLVASYFIVGKKINILSFIFSFIIITGAALVSQPSFLFGNEIENQFETSTYVGGVVIGLFIAGFSGVSRVMIARCAKVINKSDFMLLGGVAAFILGLLTPICKVENSLATPSAFFLETNMKFGLLSGLESCLSALVLLIATKTTDDPMLVSVTRSTEIVMSLIVDIISPSSQETIDFSSIYFWYKVIGAIVVTLGVMGITVSDKMYELVKKCLGRPDSNQYEEIEGDNDSNCDETTPILDGLPSNKEVEEFPKTDRARRRTLSTSQA